MEVVALIAFLIAVPAEALFTGSLSLWFWIGVVVIGLLVPFALELWSQRARARTLLIVASAFCVLLGGMVLRAVVVVGGQI